MKKVFMGVLLTGLIFIVGCNEDFDYENEEVAAIVRGEEITIGELRFLYPDKKALDNLDGTIKATLAIQEAKKMDLDVSEEMKEIEGANVYPEEANNSETAKNIRQFAHTQAAKFGMEPEEYYKEYTEKTREISFYVVGYIEEMIGEADDKAFTEQANKLLDDLVEENRDEINIRIQ
ncbi:hypothetical protein NC661_15000 [Aquibacillus koreensis]|uniref:Lipoprotein n=1 Tax=Aquibacillus koreensis TaxID=279446 RepID=A0A9X3WQQ6_9BACI|nr:hypothetical protein [Aquibacillus koreensis]MCT2534372.1 hypothetical protein [Aquibacillus koreensis]MDC3421679.1 hypothetical protein [Aquibacillus koreensis]